MDNIERMETLNSREQLQANNFNSLERKSYMGAFPEDLIHIAIQVFEDKASLFNALIFYICIYVKRIN